MPHALSFLPRAQLAVPSNKSKADVDDLIQLRDVKTNKQDTEHCMRSIETVHKMLKSITVVLIE